MKKLFTFFLLGIIICNCSPLSKKSLTKHFKSSENKFQDHIGFVLYDLETKKTVYEYNSNKYFTPGSNTKIFTFFASLKIIGDSIPAIKFIVSGDSLIFQGTGDPSFLYKNVYNNNRVFDFLKYAKQNLYFSASNLQTTHFGRGWAWDDYNDYYSPERFSFPIYGNIFTVYENKPDSLVVPFFFKKFVSKAGFLEKAKVVRQLDSNITNLYPSRIKRNRSWDVPFKVDPLLITSLLTDTLHREVIFTNRKFSRNTSLLYSLPTDSLYRVLMQDSDNFIAEQLLLTCAGILSDTLKPEITIKYVKQTLLKDLSDEPVWVDGSGLSRYNLFTPRSIINVWQKIYNLMPRERLFYLLATGGKSGTLKNWYKADEPYIFGKTGTLSNNHCLSGYLVTKKGKTFIFSFMNNNFTSTTSEIRKNMEEVLKSIYERM